METFYQLVGPDGVDECRVLGERETMPEGAVAIPRLPAMHEHWDRDAGEFVVDEEALADHGLTGHKAMAHAMKITEARLLLAGVAIDGILSAEADIAGIAPNELAEMVLAKAEPFVALELERRRIKIDARAALAREDEA